MADIQKFYVKRPFHKLQIACMQYTIYQNFLLKRVMWAVQKLAKTVLRHLWVVPKSKAQITILEHLNSQI